MKLLPSLCQMQAPNGASGVLYALLLRNIVDNATVHDKAGFWHYVVLTVLLVLSQIGMRAVIRWLNEFSRSTFENIFKARLMRNNLQKDFASVNAVHSGEWLNKLRVGTTVKIRYYDIDAYTNIEGVVTELNPPYRRLKVVKTAIPFDDIYTIELLCKNVIF